VSTCAPSGVVTLIMRLSASYSVVVHSDAADASSGEFSRKGFDILKVLPKASNCVSVINQVLFSLLASPSYTALRHVLPRSSYNTTDFKPLPLLLSPRAVLSLIVVIE